MIKGRVTSVTKLDTNVRVTESGTLPLATMVNALEEAPPGQQAISTTPALSTAGMGSHTVIIMATKGSIISCPLSPIKSALYWRLKRAKSAHESSKPKQNMNISRMGITIKMEFIGSCLVFQ